MDIFESLESLNVSEECFDEIVGIVEEIINELNKNTISSYIQKRGEQAEEAEKEFSKAKAEGTANKGLLNKYLNKLSKAQYAKEKGGQAIRYSAKQRYASKKAMEERNKDK